MNIPMPRAIPEEGKAFIRLGTKFPNEFCASYDGRVDADIAIQIWLMCVHNSIDGKPKKKV